MDYEKKYNEALERAKKIHNEILDNEILGFPDQIREIFPELRGSEDERIRKWLIDYFSSIKKTVWVHRDITCEQILEWLEKQKEQNKCPEFCSGHCVGCEQKEQKPAWSEEDTDMLNCCISSIEEAKENRYAYKETDGDTSYDREIDWLKSLRPSWKPSEEQMEALERASTNKYLSAKQFDILVSLYEHLKKLM